MGDEQRSKAIKKQHLHLTGQSKRHIIDVMYNCANTVMGDEQRSKAIKEATFGVCNIESGDIGGS